jgi:hypothetical protein
VNAPGRNGEPDRDGDGDSGDDSEEEALASCVPADHTIQMKAPKMIDGAIVDRLIAFKWGHTGWARGVVSKHYRKARGRRALNVEVDYSTPLESERRDHRLRTSDYSGCEDAAVGSWVLLEKRS